jgi:hypothetical protein
VKNSTEARRALDQSAPMELHRIAIVLVAALLAFSIAFAAGHVAAGGNDVTKAPTSTGVASPRAEPRLRLGAGARTGGVEAPPLVEPSTPAPAP